MNKKKFIVSALVLGVIIAGSGKIASAYVQESLNYNYTLSAIGTTTSSVAVTKGNTNDSKNEVATNSKPSYQYKFWSAYNGSQISSASESYGTGTKYSYFNSDSDRSYYYGKLIAMKIKTGPLTFVSIDISGRFVP